MLNVHRKNVEHALKQCNLGGRWNEEPPSLTCVLLCFTPKKGVVLNFNLAHSLMRSFSWLLMRVWCVPAAGVPSSLRLAEQGWCRLWWTAGSRGSAATTAFGSSTATPRCARVRLIRSSPFPQSARWDRSPRAMFQSSYSSPPYWAPLGSPPARICFLQARVTLG